MIVQALLEIQQKFDYLPHEELRALSQRIGQPLHRLHEVASFFPHYRLEPPPRVRVEVCCDMACHLAGGDEYMRRFSAVAAEIGGADIRVARKSCLGRCDGPPAVSINDQIYWGKTPDELEQIIRLAAAGQPIPGQKPLAEKPGWRIDPYVGGDRYAAVRQWAQLWQADPDPDETRRRIRLGNLILDKLGAQVDDGRGKKRPDEGNLRGMGGAGADTREKWENARNGGLKPDDLMEICRIGPGEWGETHDDHTERLKRRWNDDREKLRGEKYVVCNGDESEPGTFKDRDLMLFAPHLLVEGMVLAGLVIGAERGYVFIRHEYQDQIAAVEAEIQRAQAAGCCGADVLGTGVVFRLTVLESPGGYICGEETALLETIEDRRAEPREKPPLMQTEGLYGKPTVVNNVETFCWVPAIVFFSPPSRPTPPPTIKGPPAVPAGGATRFAPGIGSAPDALERHWYRSHGTHGARGMRFVSISGHVARPGVYEVPFGQTVRELICDTAGGLSGGRRLKAIASSGPSGGFLPARLPVEKISRKFLERLRARGVLSEADRHLDIFDLPLDWDLLKPDVALGAGFIVYGDDCDMLVEALNCIEFYRNESCGKCVPCRVGTQKMVQMLQDLLAGRQRGEQARSALQTLDELAKVMSSASICGLGKVAADPLVSALRYFPEDLEKHL